MKYKIINLTTKSSPISEIDDINTAYSYLNTYGWSLSHIVMEEGLSPKFKGPFCMHCHSNEHLGVDCPERDDFAW